MFAIVRNTSLVTLISAVLFLSRARADEKPVDPMSEPTKHGLRLTPDMARALARQWLAERMDPAANVTHDQQNQLSESVAKRLMDLARDHQPQVQQLFDYTFQGVLSSRGQFTPETGQKLAEKASPLVPALHEFTDNVSQDARKILNPDEPENYQNVHKG